MSKIETKNIDSEEKELPPDQSDMYQEEITELPQLPQCSTDTVDMALLLNKLPTYEEALRQVKSDFDDFETDGETAVSIARKYCTTITYKTQDHSGEWHVGGELPEYPKFLELFGVESINDIKLNDISRKFMSGFDNAIEFQYDSPEMIDAVLEIRDLRIKECRPVDSDVLTPAELDILVRHHVKDIKQSDVLNYLRDCEGTSINTLHYSDTPKLNCTIGDIYNKTPQKNLTDADVENANEHTKRINQSAKIETTPHVQPNCGNVPFGPDILQEMTKDLPGDLLNRITAVPDNMWKITYRNAPWYEPRDTFRMQYEYAGVKIEITWFVGSKSLKLSYENNSWGYDRSFNTLDSMLNSGPRWAALYQWLQLYVFKFFK